MSDVEGQSEASGFVAPDRVVLSGEGLRQFSEQEYINFVGYMASMSILVERFQEPQGTEVGEPIPLFKNDFEQAATALRKPKGTATRAWNAMTIPARRYRDAVECQNAGKSLLDNEKEQLKTPQWMLDLCPEDTVVDLAALKNVCDNSLFGDLRNFGDECAEVAIEVVKAKEAPPAPTTDVE